MIHDLVINMICEKTRLCYLNCFFCEFESQHKNIKYMSAEKLDTLLQFLNQYNIYYIDLTPRNSELLLHPEILSIIQVLIKHSSRFYFYLSSSLALSEKTFNKILNMLNHNNHSIHIHVSNYDFYDYTHFYSITKASKRIFNKISNNVKVCSNVEYITFNKLNNFSEYTYSKNHSKIHITENCLYNFAYMIDYNYDIYQCACFNSLHNYSDLKIGNVDTTDMETCFKKRKRNILNGVQTFNSCNNCYFYKSITNNEKIQILKRNNLYDKDYVFKC